MTMAPKLFTLLLAASALIALAEAQKYTTKYDNIDLQDILSNERLYKKYFECLKGGKCTPDGKELRDILPDALKTGCSKCNDKQKRGSETVFKHLIEKRPSDYAVLEKIYDPTGSYKAKYQAEAKKLGIRV